MRTFELVAAALLIGLGASAAAAEVIDLRVGYWESVWTIPGQPTTRELFCLTPEELERMRFFARAPGDCLTTPGRQTRRRYEAVSVCEEDGERMTVRWVLVAPDPMRFEVRATYEVEGATQAASGSYRWLQESCSAASKLPNS